MAVTAWLLWRASHPRLAVDGRRELFLDAGHVHLRQGFDDVDALFPWNTAKRINPDRDEIALPVRRNAVLTWDVGERGGVFTMGVARLVAGVAADEQPCVVTVSPQADAARSVTSLTVEVPPCPADPAAFAADWREGPAIPLRLELPEGTKAVTIEVRSEPVPDDLALALLSPRIEQPPRRVPADGLLEGVPIEQRLLSLAHAARAAEPVLFAVRQRTGAGAGGETEEVRVAPVEPLAAFAGTDAHGRAEGRPAIVLTGDAALDLVVDVPEESVLVGELALDSRLPAGCSATLQVLLDGRRIAQERVDSAHWRDVAIGLAGHEGRQRTLSLRVTDAQLAPGAMQATEPDYLLGDMVEVSYTPRRVRLGFADPRVMRVETVARRTATASRPSVVLVQVETLRADALPFLGGARPELTPALSDFARESVVWERAMTPSPWTVPTAASVLTGLLPSAHGAVDHDRVVLPGDALTLAERLRRAGVATGAVVASDILRPHAGFDRGFQTFAHVPYANARQVAALAESFVADHVGQQFLLFLHLFDPHSPYNAPGEWRDKYCEPALAGGQDVHAAEQRLKDAIGAGLREKRPPAYDEQNLRLLRQRYDGEIAWMDSQFARLLDMLERLGVADTTIVVFTADHGEEFMEHGLIGHGSNLHDETLHVPLVVRGLPGKGGGPQKLVGGTRVPGVVNTTSLCASVLGWMGVSFEPDALWPPLERSGPCAFSETEKGVAFDGRGDPLRRYLASVRSEGHRLLWRKGVAGEEGPGRYELYDLRADPGELHPMAFDSKSAPGADLLDCLQAAWRWSEDHEAARLLPGGTEDIFEALHQLGYVGQSSPAPAPRGGR
jgi:arylsulfatase A-like enzyme